MLWWWRVLLLYERGEAGAMGRIWLIGRLSDFDVDVAEVGRHVEVMTAGDSG